MRILEEAGGSFYRLGLNDNVAAKGVHCVGDAIHRTGG